jgi:hypothetical protein
MAEAANTLGNVVRDFRIIEALFRPGSVCHFAQASALFERVARL